MARSAAGWQVGLLIGLGFLAAAWAWRGDGRLGRQIRSVVYPFDTFSMYATTWRKEIRIPLLRDPAGNTHFPYHFGGFLCEPVQDAGPACSSAYSIDYHDDELLRHVRTHPLRPDAPVQHMELVRRHWQLQAGRAPVRLDDCVLQRCQVQP